MKTKFKVFLNNFVIIKVALLLTLSSAVLAKDISRARISKVLDDYCNSLESAQVEEYQSSLCSHQYYMATDQEEIECSVFKESKIVSNSILNLMRYHKETITDFDREKLNKLLDEMFDVNSEANTILALNLLYNGSSCQ